MVEAAVAEALRLASRDWPSWHLTPRQLADVELLSNGAYAPLTGYMTRADVESVEHRQRLADDTFWPVPVALEVTAPFASTVDAGASIALRDGEGVMVAVLHATDIWTDIGTAAAPGPVTRIGGRVDGITLPTHYDFRELRLTPAAARNEFARRGWNRVLAVPALGPFDSRARSRIVAAANQLGSGILIQVAAGGVDPADAAHYARIRALRAMIADFGPDRTMLSVVTLEPAAPALAAVVAANFGCTHVLDGERIAEIAPSLAPLSLPSRAQLESDLAIARTVEGGRVAPVELLSPSVARELRLASARSEEGLTVFFTGLSGSGKSTIANILLVKLLERGPRRVSLLDGDLVRKHLSAELTFTPADREVNVRRIAYVASEITKHGGIAICAPIAPYERLRREVRQMIEPVGGFVLVYAATPLEVCEARDRKGLYAKARAGMIAHFTGISDPFEPPQTPDVSLDTSKLSPVQAADEVVRHLEELGYLAPLAPGVGGI
jgi:sulfate adenylyltransferase